MLNKIYYIFLNSNNILYTQALCRNNHILEKYAYIDLKLQSKELDALHCFFVLVYQLEWLYLVNVNSKNHYVTKQCIPTHIVFLGF